MTYYGGTHQHGDLAPHSHEVRSDHAGVPLRSAEERTRRHMDDWQAGRYTHPDEAEPCKHVCPNCLGCESCCTCYDPAFLRARA